MAYLQNKSMITEKRLLALKTQLYGKEKQVNLAEKSLKFPKTLSQDQREASSSNLPFSINTQLKPVQNISTSELTFLKKDLLRILFLAFLAIGAQIILYLSLKQGLLKFI